jgi:hypothetical protein
MKIQNLGAPTYTPPIPMVKQDVQRAFKPVVACVWTGDKYPVSYVYKLKEAVRRHLHMDHDFFCMTEHNDPGGMFDSGIDLFDPQDFLIRKTQHHEKGWWNKLSLFNPALWRPDNKVLMLDLDCVITGPLDDFFYSDHHTTAIANFGVNYRHSKYNSSVVCWDAHGPATNVWDSFLDTGPDAVMKALHGDQCFFWRVMVDDVRTWPKPWCLSYKYEARGKPLQDECRAVIFHGKPDPHEVRDPWVLSNWTDLDGNPPV